MRNIIKNMKIKTLILVLVAIPILMALMFSSQLIRSERAVVQELNDLAKLTNLSVKMSNTLHEQQKERGATAVFLGSKGAKFKQEVAEQRKTYR